MQNYFLFLFCWSIPGKIDKHRSIIPLMFLSQERECHIYSLNTSHLLDIFVVGILKWIPAFSHPSGQHWVGSHNRVPLTPSFWKVSLWLPFIFPHTRGIPRTSVQPHASFQSVFWKCAIYLTPSLLRLSSSYYYISAFPNGCSGGCSNGVNISYFLTSPQNSFDILQAGHCMYRKISLCALDFTGSLRAQNCTVPQKVQTNTIS